MSNDRTARKRLDALLTELEEEILETEDIVSTDVAAMRFPGGVRDREPRERWAGPQ